MCGIYARMYVPSLALLAYPLNYF